MGHFFKKIFFWSFGPENDGFIVQNGTMVGHFLKKNRESISLKPQYQRAPEPKWQHKFKRNNNSNSILRKNALKVLVL